MNGFLKISTMSQKSSSQNSMMEMREGWSMLSLICAVHLRYTLESQYSTYFWRPQWNQWYNWLSMLCYYSMRLDQGSGLIWAFIPVYRLIIWLFIYRNCKLHQNWWVSLLLLLIAWPQCLAATNLSPPELVTGWVGPSHSAHAMPRLLDRHSTNEGVLRSNSACSMLMSINLLLPRRGLEPRPSGFLEVDSTARPLPLPDITDIAI